MNLYDVINAMKFNGNSGGLVTDSRTSRASKDDFADKTISVQDGKGTFALLGGAGSADFIFEIYTELKRCLIGKEKFEVKDLARYTSETGITLKREKVEALLKSTLGIDYAKALSGEGISENLRQEIKDMLLGRRFFNERYEGQLLLIGRDQEGVHIYDMDLIGVSKLFHRPYLSIGSGSNDADRILSGYFQKKRRGEKFNIPFVDGMTHLIRATNASSENIPSVGGIPTISYFDEKGITTLGEDESLLSSEIVRVSDAGLIKPRALREGLDTLLHQPGSFASVEAEVFKKSAPEYDKIMRLLRGYK